jgi:predicted membrane metal-binding protein
VVLCHGFLDLLVIFKRIRRTLCTSVLACLSSGSFSCWLSWIANKSRSKLTRVCFSGMSCTGDFPFANTMRVTEQPAG